ncbi:peptidoglycan DD-metalloendopeptidase family protein, partial [Candidatus Woesearchaeota archaeon]|nr:peptidoglycan DD-metalloendopeptidase family protein [Candidatus Woesearchaeota archaeon]
TETVVRRTMSAGERFYVYDGKIIYEDGNNWIEIITERGDRGWISSNLVTIERAGSVYEPYYFPVKPFRNMHEIYDSNAFGKYVSYQSCGFHTGFDYVEYNDISIRAVDDGRIIHIGPLHLSGPNVGRGDTSIVLWHNQLYPEHKYIYTTIAHNTVPESILAAYRKNGYVDVKAGDVIAYQASKGYSTGDHLHFELIQTDKPYTGDWTSPWIGGCAVYLDPEVWFKW